MRSSDDPSDQSRSPRRSNHFLQSIDNCMSIRVSKQREVMLIVIASTEATTKDESAELFVERNRARRSSRAHRVQSN
jgi:hypothetical protein